ncbi:hypothetical protein C0992_003008 [Termitomyces sp. T32_za158]|nr:hypothetical protein C0992_003008 [Termitomyces sp. T32_za158]
MSPTTSTRALASPASSSTITITPRRLRPKQAAKPVTPPHVRIDITSLHPITVSGLDDSELSPLTPSSSSPERRNLQEFPRLSPEPTPITSSSQIKKAPTSPRKRALKSSLLDTWDSSKLGTRVWVLIDCRARVLEPGDREETKFKKDWIWWPGKNGNHVAKPSGFETKTVEITDPGDSNIIPWLNSAGRIRFDEPAFVNRLSLGDVHASPRKKQNVDKEALKRRWHLAVEEMDGTARRKPSSRKPPVSPTEIVEASRPFPFPEVDDSYDSDLPEVGTEEFRTYPPSAPSSPIKGASGPTSSQRNMKRKRSVSLDAIKVVTPRWSPRPPDISIAIPGELVLASERGSDSTYWPARVLDYLPADKPTKLDKYHVEFLDGKTQSIPRHWFYIAEEENFATCKLGEWDSAIVEVQNDDEDNTIEQDRELPQFRSPSPIYIYPPPSVEDFKLLSIREQFAYAKPVLSAILNENFPPALQRHIDFVSGGSKRKSVVEEAGLRGQMDPRDVDALQRYVTEWCLRDEQRAQVITDEEDTFLSSSQDNVELNHSISSSVNRSVSPAATEILSEAELPPSSFVTSFEYCLNVLLPEAILQILLWRTGERTSPDLLGDAEATLHAKGLELLRASDWVNDVMRLRMTAIGQLGKSKRKDTNQGRAKDDGEIMYSITGRPRRTVGAPKSYLE